MGEENDLEEAHSRLVKAETFRYNVGCDTLTG